MENHHFGKTIERSTGPCSSSQTVSHYQKVYFLCCLTIFISYATPISLRSSEFALPRRGVLHRHRGAERARGHAGDVTLRRGGRWKVRKRTELCKKSGFQWGIWRIFRGIDQERCNSKCYLQKFDYWYYTYNMLSSLSLTATSPDA